MFNVYIDYEFEKIWKINIVWKIGMGSINIIANSDNIVLLVPSVSGFQYLLNSAMLVHCTVNIVFY